jgi:hypothetical protein
MIFRNRNKAHSLIENFGEIDFLSSKDSVKLFLKPDRKRSSYVGLASGGGAAVLLCLVMGIYNLNFGSISLIYWLSVPPILGLVVGFIAYLIFQLPKNDEDHAREPLTVLPSELGILTVNDDVVRNVLLKPGTFLVPKDKYEAYGFVSSLETINGEFRADAKIDSSKEDLGGVKIVGKYTIEYFIHDPFTWLEASGGMSVDEQVTASHTDEIARISASRRDIFTLLFNKEDGDKDDAQASFMKGLRNKPETQKCRFNPHTDEVKMGGGASDGKWIEAVYIPSLGVILTRAILKSIDVEDQKVRDKFMQQLEAIIGNTIVLEKIETIAKIAERFALLPKDENSEPELSPTRVYAMLNDEYDKKELRDHAGLAGVDDQTRKLIGTRNSKE